MGAVLLACKISATAVLSDEQDSWERGAFSLFPLETLWVKPAPHSSSCRRRLVVVVAVVVVIGVGWWWLWSLWSSSSLLLLWLFNLSAQMTRRALSNNACCHGFSATDKQVSCSGPKSGGQSFSSHPIVRGEVSQSAKLAGIWCLLTKEMLGETASPTRIQASNGTIIRKKGLCKSNRSRRLHCLQRPKTNAKGTRGQFEAPPPSLPRAYKAICRGRFLTWNCGGLSITWTEMLSSLQQPKYATVKLRVLTETQWKEETQFQSEDWRVLNLGSKERNAGLLILMHSSLASMDAIRFQHLVPGRLAH